MQWHKKTLWLVLVAALLFTSVGAWVGRAAKAGDVAYVDLDLVFQEYVAKQVEPPIKAEVDKLQKEFDAKSAGMSNEAKTELFNKYQSQINEKRQALESQYWAKVDAAMRQVAQEAGFSVILSKPAVLYGGVDLTTQLLGKLNVKK